MNNFALIPLIDQFKQENSQFHPINFHHIYMEHNSYVDELSKCHVSGQPREGMDLVSIIASLILSLVIS